MITRRQALAAPALLFQPPAGRLLVDTHIHLFDPVRFPYHSHATYRPPAVTLEDYGAFAVQAGIRHAIIVHPEPYQDDHRYLEYCFEHEPRPGFFKGTCLFDPIATDTPQRMRALAKKWNGRIVALRIHENRERGKPPTTSGPIRDRDLMSPAMRKTWSSAAASGLGIQMHFIPCHAPQIGALAREFRDVPVILDHLARSAEGTPSEYEEVIRLSELPRVYMKFSGVNYSSRTGPPHLDVQPLVKRIHRAFGADRIIWGGLGMNRAEFDQRQKMFKALFDFASEADRIRIQGLNAARLFKFPETA